MAGFSIDVRSDINAILATHRGLHDNVLKAAAKAVNATAEEVRKVAIAEIAGRNPEYKPSVIKGYVTVRKAKYKAQRTRGDGMLRVNYGGITATVSASGKPPNLIYLATKQGLKSFRNSPGVVARINGKPVLYNRTFIVKNKQTGKKVVVSRQPDAKRHKVDNGPKSTWEWQEKWSKGIYGPSIAALAGTRTTIEVMDAEAKNRWPAFWAMELHRMANQQRGRRRS